MSRRLNWWGWGFEDARPKPQELAAAVVETLGFGSTEIEQPARLESIELPSPRLQSPFSSTKDDRMRHAYGRSYLDTVRAFRGRFDHAPDAVAHPRSEGEVELALEWAAKANAAVIPYGGGTSVCGGVEPAVPSRFDGVLSLDMSAMDRVLELDGVSRAALIWRRSSASMA
jgi:alkyldihydroxyacetonephosphate synthase